VTEQTVVCLEDDRDLAHLIQVTIRPWTQSFLTAYDGIHGLELIRRERPALILLDLNLPGLNGLEVFARMQDDPQLRRIPVIMISGSQREASASRSRFPLERVAAYITKPFSLSELRDIVRPYLVS